MSPLRRGNGRTWHKMSATVSLSGIARLGAYLVWIRHMSPSGRWSTNVRHERQYRTMRGRTYWSETLENFEERGQRRRTSLQTTSSTIGRDLRCGQVCTLYGRVGGSYVPSHRDPHRHHPSPKTVLHPLREASSSGVRKNLSVSRECATGRDERRGGISRVGTGWGRMPKFHVGTPGVHRGSTKRKASYRRRRLP